MYIRSLFVKTLLTTAVILVLAAGSMADWQWGDGFKMHRPQLPDEAGWDVNATWPFLTADDWLCIGTGPVAEIHFWGSWQHGIEGSLDAFNLKIFSDIPADPPQIPYSRPGELLWQLRVPIAEVIVRPIATDDVEGWYGPNSGEVFWSDHNEYFQYNVYLPNQDWFLQEEGTIYWLGIGAEVALPQENSWGWKSTDNHWNDGGVWGVDDPPYTWIELLEPAWVYTPGDVDGSGWMDINDLIYMIDWLEQGGPPPPCGPIPNTDPPFYPCADLDGDCDNDLDDAALIVEGNPGWCPDFPPPGFEISMDLAFVISDGSDNCCLRPIRGNIDYDYGDAVDISDLVYLVDFMFNAGPVPLCMQEADVDCTGGGAPVDIADLVFLVDFMFNGGPTPCRCDCANCP